MSPALGFDCVAPSVSDGHFLFRFADHLICVFVIINSLIQSFRITDEFFYFTLLSLPSLADEFYLVLPSFSFEAVSFSSFFAPLVTGFCRILLGFDRVFTICNGLLSSFTEFYLLLLGFTGFSLGFTVFYWV